MNNFSVGAGYIEENKEIQMLNEHSAHLVDARHNLKFKHASVLMF